MTALDVRLTLCRPVNWPTALLFIQTPEAMPEEIPSAGSDRSRFRTTLIRVIIVQVVALALLLFLQLRYQL